ncbi:MAG: hypothetical protein QXI84_09380 [Thermofilaceae archaeon]
MRCFVFEERSSGVWPGDVLAVRRVKVDFHVFEVAPGVWAGVVGGPPRETYVAFTRYVSSKSLHELGSMWRIGTFEGFVADFPYPPLPGVGEDGQVHWSRLVVNLFEAPRDVGYAVQLPTLALVEGTDLIGEPPPIALRLSEGFPGLVYSVFAMRYPISGWNTRLIRPDRIPGSGKLTGEEFRIVERDNDYLRLVGRGGDEYIAWDFVLGTLDTGEWVLMGEDGLYIAKREGDKVVAKWPYRGSVLDVRGPPYMPYYPVIPVKWVREQLEKVGEVARRVGARRWDYYTPPVDPELVLKWPVRSVKWEFVVRPAACEDGLWGPLYGTREAQWFGCEDLCDLDEYLALKYKRRICGRARPE